MRKNWGLLFVSVVVFFSACASANSAVPMTPNLIQEVGAENLEGFYFYFSKDIVLERDEPVGEPLKFQDGVAIPFTETVKELIEIKKTTPGLAKKKMLTEAAYVTYTPTENELRVTVEKDGRQVKSYVMGDRDAEAEAKVLANTPSVTFRLLGVSFEEPSETRQIGFAASMLSTDGTFNILFDDENSNSILYDGKLYHVVYKGEERPYLMVKLGKAVQKMTKTKRAVTGLSNRKPKL